MFGSFTIVNIAKGHLKHAADATKEDSVFIVTYEVKVLPTRVMWNTTEIHILNHTSVGHA